ncbi:hypothetical protein D3227_33365 [Mesorhizobium waimense]|uniref:Uncharacterized protein n=2 Tax=Mesorhizobium waimense TaxID=1300307 RepID=A0A3A5K2E5_9HYPH|nr:hypothetical protein D3227_33365 [Mesorhizobium waimense]
MKSEWDSHRITGEIGVPSQMSYQYGFDPETRGARVISADKLDRLRGFATEAEADRRDRGFPAFLPRAEHLWLVFGVGVELLLETAWLRRAAWHCGVAMPMTTPRIGRRSFRTTTSCVSTGSGSGHGGC